MLPNSISKLYIPRHPERTLFYQTVAEHYETWLELASADQFSGQGDHHSPNKAMKKCSLKSRVLTSSFACVCFYAF
jgi:hypothetical protein